MDPKFQTSFIPKRPMFPAGLGVQASRVRNPMSIIATIIFIVALLLSLGVFFYNQTLAFSNGLKKQNIDNEIKAFEPGLTSDLTTLKSRIDGANDLLKNHIALSMFFGLLEKSTVSTIQFKDLTISGGPGKRLSVSMKGIAKSFNDVIFQSDTMSNANFIKNSKFSDFSFNETGDVVFKFVGEIDPAYILYQKAIDQLSTGTTNSENTVTTPTATTTTP